MQIKDVRPEWYTKQIRCDRCGLLFVHGDAEFHEAVSIELIAGYGSLFGDGKVVQIDLCQHCLQLTLGPWLRIAEPGRDMQVIEQSSDIFCSKLAGEDAESKEELAKQWSNPEGELPDASTSATL
ncbi:MAG: hypothetical protein K2W93_10555, partial [Burkholderiaceae bacterium]|nr:hypothetical protein [Burkholderiaceae bacterium]